MKNKHYTQAVRDLTEFLVRQYGQVEFKVAGTTTNNFNKFKEETTNNGGIMTVSLEGCTDTIYGNEYINLLGRVWHDTVHLRLNLNFFEHDETIVAKAQKQEVFKYIQGKYGNLRATYVSILIWIDIYEQVIYYKNTGEFVENQEQFVYDKFLEEIGVDNVEI